MVDVGTKPESARVAVAEGRITMTPDAIREVEASRNPKGNVLATAELAGTMGAKRTADLVPLCHPIGLDHVEVKAAIDSKLPGIRVRATVKAVSRTGVEMEALTAVAVALLTIYDMVKAADRGMEMGEIRLVEKSGGTRGPWRREAS